MCKAMKFVTSISSNDVLKSVDYVYVESPEIVKNVYFVNTFKRHSPCDNCPNNPSLNKFASGFCNCTLNLPDITQNLNIYFHKSV